MAPIRLPNRWITTGVAIGAGAGVAMLNPGAGLAIGRALDVAPAILERCRGGRR